MIPEAPFVFSIGALNLSLAGLAGLVATLRRGSAGEFPALDRFRLREIVEFSFANALLALALVPMASTIGDVEVTVRILGAGALAYQLTSSLLLRRRQLARDLAVARPALALILVLNLAILVAGVLCVLTGSIGAYEWLLLSLLARPMLAFVLVLESFEHAQ